jgi:hypothetical protein
MRCERPSRALAVGAAGMSTYCARPPGAGREAARRPEGELAFAAAPQAAGGAPPGQAAVRWFTSRRAAAVVTAVVPGRPR